MDQNNDSSGFDQIQSSQNPVNNHLSQVDVEEVLQDKEKFMQDTQTFLENFNHFSFGFTPRVLTIAWERIDKIKYVLTEPEEIPELMYKLCEDVQNIREELAEYIDSPSWNSPTLYDEDEEYTIQYREYLEKSPDAVTTVLPTEEPEYLLSMGYEHPNTTSETESNKIIKSGVEELVPIPNECEVTSEDKRECDMLVNEDSSTFNICDDHFEILSDSNDDDISSNDDAFEDIEYVEASLPVLELASLEEENVEEEEFNLEDIQDVVLREKLLSINRLIANIKSLNDNPTPDRMLNYSASFPIFEESDNSLLDNSSPEFKTFSDHTKETSSEVDLFLASDNSIPPGIENFDYDSEGDIHFLEELLIGDSIPFPNNESFDFEDDQLFPRPPPEPPDVEFFFDSKPDVIAEEISDKCFDPGGEINVFANDEDDDYFPFMFVIRIFLSYLTYHEVFPLLLSAESKDTIFDPGISV
nr:hypothetical protein [Tanacetum cinerariifolium]